MTLQSRSVLTIIFLTTTRFIFFFCKGMLYISVIDSGAGISTENQKKLFKEVIQFNPEKLQSGGGSGFGLYICKGIVDLHEGFLSVFSEGEGLGSTFTVQLPMEKASNKVLAEAVVSSCLNRIASDLSRSQVIRDKQNSIRHSKGSLRNNKQSSIRDSKGSLRNNKQSSLRDSKESARNNKQSSLRDRQNHSIDVQSSIRSCGQGKVVQGKVVQGKVVNNNPNFTIQEEIAANQDNGKNENDSDEKFQVVICILVTCILMNGNPH